MTVFRVVLDTNIVVSGLLWSGPPHALLTHALHGKIQLSTSRVLVDELLRTLQRPKFRPRLRSLDMDPKSLCDYYRCLAVEIVPMAIPPTILADLSDDAVLACALTCKADLIASGDTHLLALREFRNIPILDPAKALLKISGHPSTP